MEVLLPTPIDESKERTFVSRVNFEFDGEIFEISTEANDLGAVRDALEEKGYKFLSAEVAYVPQTMSSIDDPDLVTKMEKLIDMLEENDDVQAVWHNWEMPEE